MEHQPIVIIIKFIFEHENVKLWLLPSHRTDNRHWNVLNLLLQKFSKRKSQSSFPNGGSCISVATILLQFATTWAIELLRKTHAKFMWTNCHRNRLECVAFAVILEHKMPSSMNKWYSPESHSSSAPIPDWQNKNIRIESIEYVSMRVRLGRTPFPHRETTKTNIFFVKHTHPPIQIFTWATLCPWHQAEYSESFMWNSVERKQCDKLNSNPWIRWRLHTFTFHIQFWRLRISHGIKFLVLNVNWQRDRDRVGERRSAFNLFLVCGAWVECSTVSVRCVSSVIQHCGGA